METEKGRIVRGSAGSFLDPPSYPTHEFQVETDLRRRPENRDVMSLTYAADCEYLDPATRREARERLAAWDRPPLDEPETAEWVAQVLGYFRDCYRSTDPEHIAAGTEWHASNLHVVRDGEARPNDEHAGVHLIRKYYPEYEPNAEDFARARWGK